MAATAYSLAQRLGVPAAPAANPPGERPPSAPAAPHGAAASFAPSLPASREQLIKLKDQFQRLLADVLKPGTEFQDGGAHVRALIDGYLDEALIEAGITFSRADRARLFDWLVAEVLGFGPIDPLLRDDSVSEIMVNGPFQIWIERKGMIQEVDVTFEDEPHVRRIIDRIVSPLGRRCDESSPMVDARLPDGSRVNAIIPPLSLVGSVLTIRKFSKQPLTVQSLVDAGSMTQEVADLLAAFVRGHANILIAGGTGSGKTTLLNVLSSFIPDHERIVTIEDAAELQLRQRHVITLEARPPNLEGAGAITIRHLLVNALRMRPDRIVVGECRGAEALDMLQAMNTGHDGSMTTLHANTPRDVLSRIETMVLMAGTALPHRAIREQIASAIHLIIQQQRLQDGSRRITEISEVQGMEGDVIVLEPIFRFVQRGTEGKRIVGRLEPTGVRPRMLPRLAQHGITLPPGTFTAAAEPIR